MFEYLIVKPELRCVARARSTGDQCKNPRAYGMKVCRYHGARKNPNALRGADHPNFKHGERVNEAKHRATRKELKALLALGLEYGLFANPRTGKPAKNKRALELPSPCDKRKAKC